MTGLPRRKSLGTMVAEGSMDFLQIRFLGNRVEDYVIALATFVLFISFLIVANRILKRYVRSWVKKTETDLDDLIVERVFSPLTYFILIVGVALTKSHIVLTPGVSLWVDRILAVCVVVIGFVILMRFIEGLIELLTSGYTRRLRQREPSDLEQQIRNAERVKRQVREVSKMVLGVLAILTVLSNLGVDLKAIWASLGIGGIALMVAVQEPLRNLVGRIYIYSTGIFHEGHFIVFNELQ
jgi:MscS family membrane protein